MINGKNVRLRRKLLSDARDDYNWQTDDELARLDATHPVKASFSHYAAEYAFDLCNPSSTRQEFAVETLEGKRIGNCVYYDIDKAKGETQIGIFIGDRDYWNKGYGVDTVTTLVNHIFNQPGFKRVYLKTLTWNKRAQQCFRKCGFKPCGNLNKDGYKFQLMDMTLKNWQERQSKADKP